MKKQKQQGGITVFISYAQADHAVSDHLATHLSQLTRDGFIEAWSDQQIIAGADRVQQIDLAIRRSSLILLLISAEFLASDACYDGEMQHALERHRAGEAHVIPIIVRPCYWQGSLFAHLQCLPRDTKPIAMWDHQDQAFAEIVMELRAVVELLRRPVVIVSCLPHHLFSKHLAQDLIARGIPFRETETTQEPATLREHIREASVVVVITSPGIEPTRTRKDVENLAKRYQRPLIGLWIIDTARDEEMDVSVPSPDHKWIVVTPGQEQSSLQELCAAIQRKRFHHSGLSLASPQEAPIMLQKPRNPYKGLDAFTTADAGDFFGRTALVETLVEMVTTTLSQEKQGKPPARLLAVVGASGSGKSSLVQAGLLPALHAGRVTHSDTWLYLDPIVPGAHPLQELASLLLEYVPDKSLEMIRGDMHSASLSALHSYAQMIAKQRGSKHIVLVVDQFEEVFTLTEQEQERQQFLDLLVTACTKPGGPLLVVLTLRGDFYGHLMQYEDLYKMVRDHLTSMLPMTLPDVRAVITEPATLPDVHLTFEGNLVGDLLSEVQGQIGALPLLQFTLQQLFERREGHLLTEHAYQEMGSIRGALTKHAEACYDALPSDAHRDLARTLFLRLLDPMTEQETTRRRATLTEFAFPDERKTSVMQETIAAFVKARLLTINANERVGTTTIKARLRTTTANEKTNTTTVEVNHEALIRHWPRLIDWLRTARDDIHLQQNISRDVVTWEQQRRSSDHLYQGNKLKAAQAWAQRHNASRQEHAFLKASAARRLRALLTVIGVILLVVASSGIAGWYTFFQPQPTLVRTQQDDEIGSLRWCINNAPSGSTITFAQNVGKLIKLTGGDLVVGGDRQLTIVGPGASQLAISSGNLNAHIHVSKGTTLHISGLSFKDSKIVAHGFLDNEGSLTVTNSVISNNMTTAAVTNLGVPNGFGFGGSVVNSGTLTVINSNISGNGVNTGWGSGIYNSGTLTLTNSIIANNTTTDGDDGGIANDLKGMLIITNSTISGNIASNNNGGIGNDGTRSRSSRSNLSSSMLATFSRAQWYQLRGRPSII